MVFDAAFTRFFLSAPSEALQDDLPSARREPGPEGNGREAETARKDRAPPSAVDGEDAFLASGGPMTPIESSDDEHRRGRARRKLQLQPARC